MGNNINISQVKWDDTSEIDQSQIKWDDAEPQKARKFTPLERKSAQLASEGRPFASFGTGLAEDLRTEVASPVMSGLSNLAGGAPKETVGFMNPYMKQQVFPEQRTLAGKGVRFASEAAGILYGLPSKIALAGLKVASKAPALVRPLVAGAIAGGSFVPQNLDPLKAAENVALGAVLGVGGQAVAKVAQAAGTTAGHIGNFIQNTSMGQRVAEYGRQRGFDKILKPEYYTKDVPNSIKQRLNQFFPNATRMVGQKIDSLVNAPKHQSKSIDAWALQSTAKKMAGEIEDYSISTAQKKALQAVTARLLNIGELPKGKVTEKRLVNAMNARWMSLNDLWTLRKDVDTMVNDRSWGQASEALDYLRKFRKLLNDPIRASDPKIANRFDRYHYLKEAEEQYGANFEGLLDRSRNPEDQVIESQKISAFLNRLMRGDDKGEMIKTMRNVENDLGLGQSVVDDMLDYAAARQIKENAGRGPSSLFDLPGLMRFQAPRVARSSAMVQRGQQAIGDISERALPYVSRFNPLNQPMQQGRTSPRGQGGFAAIGSNPEPKGKSFGAFAGPELPTLKTLRHLEGKESVSKQYISDLTNQPDLKQAERDVIRQTLAEFSDKIPVKEFENKVRVQLLPLKRNLAGPDKYESVSLPDELRGPVENYREHIYESPIKTSAGAIHFGYYDVGRPRANPERYFAHTRVEDLPKPNTAINYKGAGYVGAKKGTTSRIIELQSDLFQKGNLEMESFGMREQATGMPKDKYGIKVREAFNKLRPYENTWHERIIREEIKQAAKDGKTKLQFPTGETAMKIEGLSEVNEFRWIKNEQPMGYVNKREMLIGDEIARSNLLNDRWIITDVLGDGKFKAVPKREYLDRFMKNGIEGNLGPEKQEIFNQLKETFDISGKIDTSNPIYRFYEKEVAKYLKRISPNMRRIKDAQGVEWHEIDVAKEAGMKPVEAFAIAGGGAAAISALNPVKAQAGEDVDMDRIYTIESSNDPKAHNKPEDARGLGQIRPITLKEWNNFHPKEQYTSEALFNATVNKKIANWYMNERIPKMLKSKGIEDTVDNRIKAYNFGVGNLKNKKTLPKTTIDYLKKYHKQGDKK